MLTSFSPEITYQMAEFPAAYDIFLPVNRGRYDVLVLYHMWDKITDDQARMFVDCIKSGKPVVVLHHSLCAFESWPEYRHTAIPFPSSLLSVPVHPLLTVVLI
jgi:hypothetical protein